jgi:hypothetical protein
MKLPQAFLPLNLGGGVDKGDGEGKMSDKFFTKHALK